MWLNDKRRRKYSKNWGMIVTSVEPRASAATSSAPVFTCSISNMLQALNSDGASVDGQTSNNDYSMKWQAFIKDWGLHGSSDNMWVQIFRLLHHVNQEYQTLVPLVPLATWGFPCHFIRLSYRSYYNYRMWTGRASHVIFIKPFSWRVKKAQDRSLSQDVTNNKLHQMDHSYVKSKILHLQYSHSFFIFVPCILILWKFYLFTNRCTSELS